MAQKKKPRGISLGSRPPEERKAIASKGGKASAEAQRKKRQMQEVAELILNMPLKGGKKHELEEIMSFGALKGKNITVQEAMVYQQARKALKGDKNAAEFVRDTAGQKPKDKVDVGGAIPVVLCGDEDIPD